jgi:hypothetical protein
MSNYQYTPGSRMGVPETPTNTLDIVHPMHVLSNWIPDAMLDFKL